MRDLAAATAALDAASRISQQEEEEEGAPRFRGPLREDAAVEKRRVAPAAAGRGAAGTIIVLAQRIGTSGGATGVRRAPLPRRRRRSDEG